MLPERLPLNTRALLVLVAIAGVGAGPLASACSSDSKRLSGKGEACQVTNDCDDGLVCQPVPGGTSGGLCVLGSFGIAPTAKECVVIECATDTDCCPKPPSNCDELLAECELVDAGVIDAGFDAGADGGSPCASYDAVCTCNTHAHACSNARCFDLCQSDFDCPRGAALGKCSAGVCVQCAVDTDCASSGLSCVNGRCQPPCISDGDCPGFERCVGTVCIASGCQSDRECVASTRNVSATCAADGRCRVPCVSDLECGSALDYTFLSCIDGMCTYTGCQSDKDCRLLLGADGGSLPPSDHVFCRDTPPAGQTTVSADGG